MYERKYIDWIRLTRRFIVFVLICILLFKIKYIGWLLAIIISPTLLYIYIYFENKFISRWRSGIQKAEELEEQRKFNKSQDLFTEYGELSFGTANLYDGKNVSQKFISAQKAVDYRAIIIEKDLKSSSAKKRKSVATKILLGKENTLIDTCFEYLDLSDIQIIKKQFINCSFRNTYFNSIKDCTFINCHFEDSNLEGSDMTNTKFVSERLFFDNSNLTNAMVDDLYYERVKSLDINLFEELKRCNIKGIDSIINNYQVEQLDKSLYPYNNFLKDNPMYRNTNQFQFFRIKRN